VEPVQVPANDRLGVAVGLGVASALGLDLGLGAASRFGFGVGVVSGTSENGAGRRCAVTNS